MEIGMLRQANPLSHCIGAPLDCALCRPTARGSLKICQYNTIQYIHNTQMHTQTSTNRYISRLCIHVYIVFVNINSIFCCSVCDNLLLFSCINKRMQNNLHVAYSLVSQISLLSRQAKTPTMGYRPLVLYSEIYAMMQARLYHRCKNVLRFFIFF